MLGYPLQISELEKIARLEPTRRARPARLCELTERSSSARCLVCGKSPARACNGCRAVHYCGAEHQRADAEWHEGVCQRLRSIAEDAELRARLSVDALNERLLNTSAAAPHTWESYLGADCGGAERRVVTDLGSRPLTLAWLLSVLELKMGDSFRLHVIGASAKELEATDLYATLTQRFAPTRFEVAFVGPELPRLELPAVPGATFGFHAGEYRRALWSSLGMPDLVVGFDAGLLLYRSWQPTLFDLLESGVPFALTSYREWEARAEAQVLAEVGARCLLPPQNNPFASLSCRRSSTLANDVSYDNAFVSAWRGPRGG
jgi:hypothetical protein